MSAKFRFKILNEFAEKLQNMLECYFFSHPVYRQRERRRRL